MGVLTLQVWAAEPYGVPWPAQWLHSRHTIRCCSYTLPAAASKPPTEPNAAAQPQPAAAGTAS